MNKLKGKFYKFKFPKRKSQIEGIVLDSNESWTLIARISDYTLDGFTIFKNGTVQASDAEYEKFASKILKLKNYSQIKKPGVPLNNLESILSYLDRKYKLFGLDTLDGEACDVVRYLGRKNDVYFFRELTTRAKWRFKLQLPEHELRYIHFDTNYLNSLKLVTLFKS